MNTCADKFAEYALGSFLVLLVIVSIAYFGYLTGWDKGRQWERDN